MILRGLIKNISNIQLNIIKQITYKKSGTFNASPDTVFNVVKNTQKYNQFIPWCSKSTIVKQIQKNQNYTQLTIRFNKIKQLSYLSHVKIQGQSNQSNTNKSDQYKNKYRIKSICKQQPLKSLISIWEIDKNGIVQGDNQLTNVYYQIEYEFSSPLLQLTSHLFLDYVGESMWLIFKEQSQRKQKQISKKSMINNNSSKISFSKYDGTSIHKNNQNKQTINQSNTQNQIEKKQLKNKQESNKQKQNIAGNLTQYLDKNKKIHQIYIKNKQFKRKLDQWSKIIQGTNNFQQKLQFHIKNYLIHKN